MAANTQRCIVEFGEHTDHTDCERMLDAMSGEPSMDYLRWEQEQFCK